VNEPQPQLPSVDEVLVSTTASLVNLAGIRLTDEEQRDPVQAKAAIDAARELLPLCPEEAAGPIKDALAQLQMLYVKETGSPGQQGPGEAAPEQPSQPSQPSSKIWTPPGS
jgi:hypothetical protein